MPDTPPDLDPKKKHWLYFIAILTIVEALITLAILFSIPPDPKNSFLLGLSWQRWLIILAVLSILAHPVVWVLNLPAFIRYVERASSSAGKRLWVEIYGILSGIFLWVVIWFPIQDAGRLADDFERIQPPLTLFLLACFQLSLAIRYDCVGTLRRPISGKNEDNRPSLLLIALLFSLAAIVFLILFAVKPAIGSSERLFFPVSSILAPLQIFSAWAIFFLWQIYAPRTEGKWRRQRKWQAAGLVLVWLAAFLVWSNAGLPCTGDRPGPHTPNNICYPSIDDAVYSTGAFYIGLGEGVYNHWLTDKPLYLVFLAAGQALFGANIDRYLILQIAVLALIPMLLLYFSRRMLGFSGAVLAAVFMIWKGYNEIHLYSMVGGMNVKIENTEGLMALILVLLGMCTFRWFRKPENPLGGVMTGGILGLGVLVRFNPLAILPLLLGMILWANRKKLRQIRLGLLLFLATFLLTIAPWFISARDENGVSFYYQKIMDVINIRFDTRSGSDNSAGTPHLASLAGPARQEQTTEPSFSRDFFLHFLNNEYQALAEFPINFVFHPAEVIPQQNLWDMSPQKTIWQSKLSTENVLALGLNLFFIVLGVATLWKRFGAAGLIPLLIQSGYFLGNAAAMTSGERYLQPVSWVNVLYYCVGIVWLIQILAQFATNRDIPALFCDQPGEEDAPAAPKHAAVRTAAWMAAFLLIGALPMFANMLPQRLPPEHSAEAKQYAGQVLADNGVLTPAQWESFLVDPNALVVQVKAYHPRNYRNESYFPGSVLFELMGLGRDYVYVSHMVGFEASQPFSDGSDMILAGCRTGMDEIWNSKRVLMRSFAVIQTSHEENVIFAPAASWDCTP